jgi:hypothetical protein
LNEVGKRVVVIASGETERRSLPHLVAHQETEDVRVLEVRIPPGGKALNLETAERLVKAVWYQRISAPPDKFVILVDADGRNPDDIIRPFREQLPTRIGAKVAASLQFACAQWHLEAWYFADGAALRDYLGRDTGNVDISTPDEIQNPKLHLKHLLGTRVYTAVVSEEIATRVNPNRLGQCSPSFRTFLDAIRNGVNVVH